MSEILVAGGMYYSLVYDTEKKMYGYSRDGYKGWHWAKRAKDAENMCLQSENKIKREVK